MKTNNTALITDIQRFCMHDGPGVRTTVFFKGCPLHCAWCHNPETQSRTQELLFYRKKCRGCGRCAAVCPTGAQMFGSGHTVDRELCISCGRCAAVCPAGALEVSGKIMTVEEIGQEVERDVPFYGKTGGLTVSGGEPTCQLQALCELLRYAKESGISTCVETCGCFSGETAKRLAPLTDLFLFDIKDTDPMRLKQYTGADYKTVTGSLLRLDALGCPTVLRCITVPGVNDQREHFEAVAALFWQLHHCRYVELLPYHPYGETKSAALGETAAQFRKPAKAEMEHFAGILAGCGVPVRLFGQPYNP